MDAIIGFFLILTVVGAFVAPAFDTPRSLRRYQRRNLHQ